MEPSRLKTAILLSFTIAVYVLYFNKPPMRANESGRSTFTPISFVYEGYETGTENLILAFLDKKSQNQTATFRMFHYIGPWESEEQNFISFHVIFDSDDQKRLIKNDQDYFFSTNYQKLSKISPKLEISYESLQAINGTIYNNDVPLLKFDLSVMDSNIVYMKRLIYGIGSSILYTIYYLALYRHYKQCEFNQSFAVKTSLLTWIMLELLELSFMFWQINKAFEKPIPTGADFILISAFWSFCAYIFIHTRILVKVYTALNPALADFPFYIQSRLVSMFQSRCFSLIVMTMITMKLLSKFYYLTLPALHLFFVPQIVLNSIKGSKQSFNMNFILSVFCVRTVILLYFCVFPYNVLRNRPEYFLAVQVFGLLALQAAALVFQNSNPRFLVPKKYRPVTYSYFRSESEESYLEVSENICTICMTGLNLAVNTEPVHNFSKTMHTPCNHLFHQDCLTRWMEIKLECPTCRTCIPQFID